MVEFPSRDLVNIINNNTWSYFAQNNDSYNFTCLTLFSVDKISHTILFKLTTGQFKAIQSVEWTAFFPSMVLKHHYHHHHHHHYHKHQGLDPLIRSVSRVKTALANVCSVFQLFSFLVVCSDMISKGFGLVAFFASVKASSVCIHLSCLICIQSVFHGVRSRLSLNITYVHLNC